MLPQAFDLAENFNAQELSKRCALFCLEKYKEMHESGVKSPAAYAVLMQVGVSHYCRGLVGLPLVACSWDGDPAATLAQLPAGSAWLPSLVGHS